MPSRPAGRRRLPRGARLAIPAVAAGLAIGGVITALLLCGFGVAAQYGDAWNYLAAGERLNAGSALYAIAPGDRPVQIVPPYWTVPLLSPPPIAVPWRLLALLGENGMTAWGVLTLAAPLALAAVMLRANVTRGLLVLAPVAAPLAITALSGNVNALLAPALMAAWWLRERPRLAGPLLAASIAVKVTPAAFIVWLVLARRWRLLGTTALAGAAIVGGSVLVVGVAPWLDWIRETPGSAPSPLAIATLLSTSTAAVTSAGAALVLAVALVTRSERAVFAACALVAALVTPALYHQALAMLVVCGAPLIVIRGRLRWRLAATPATEETQGASSVTARELDHAGDRRAA